MQAVVQELRGEKIDIVPWTRDIAKFVCNALAPAEVSRMIIDDDQKLVLVIVADDQLSLAIGRKGQNVRLASQLTGWNIDIKSETEMETLTKEARSTLGKVPGIGPVLAEKLYLEGFTTAFDLAQADIEILAAIPGIGKIKSNKIITAAADFFAKQREAGEVDAKGKPFRKKRAAATAEGEAPGEAEAGEESAETETSPEGEDQTAPTPAVAPAGDPAADEPKAAGPEAPHPEGEPVKEGEPTE